MKQTHTIWMRLFVGGLLCLILLALPAAPTHIPKRAEAHPSERQFTPVYSSEKKLGQLINRQRQHDAQQPLAYDWDLFRFARFFAQQSANSGYTLPSSEKIDSLLNGLGRSAEDSHCIVIRTARSAAFPRSWWTSHDGVRLLRDKQATALGIGSAANGNQRAWVVLYATVKQPNQ